MGGSTGLSWLYLINMQSSYGREETGEIIWPFCEPVMPISYKINDKIFWTDSQVVLAYIRSDVQCFKIFVANWVQQIRG